MGRIKHPKRSFVYNDDLLGEVEGLAGTENEAQAIYWLQGARREEAHAERVEAALSDGWVNVEEMSATEQARRPESVLMVGRGKVKDFKCGDGSSVTVVGVATDWVEIPEGRVVYDAENGRPTLVLPKGARSRGERVDHRRVLVRFKSAIKQEKATGEHPVAKTRSEPRFQPGDLIRAYVIFGKGPIDGKILSADGSGGFEIKITEPGHRLVGEAMAVIERQLVRRVGSDRPTG